MLGKKEFSKKYGNWCKPNSINQVWPRTCSDLVGRTLGGGKGGTAQVIFYLHFTKVLCQPLFF